MRALITGATGFVGGALARRLCEQGHEVRALLRPGRPCAALQQAGAVVERGELGDPNTIAAAALGRDVVFHCAGASALHAPARALAWINVAGTENALAAARHAGVPRFVMLSCADVTLVDRDRIHWKETAALGQEPLGAWARAKLLAEEIALQASDARLTTVALRPAFLWGPDDTLNLPPLCAEAAHRGVRLFGNGQNLFATTYIENLIDALIVAAQAPGVGGQALHVADAEVLTAREFLTKLCAAVGLPPPRGGHYATARWLSVLRKQLGGDGPWPEDVARRGRGCLLDCMRAIQLLDYEPQVTVEQGMAALGAWAAERGGPPAIAKLARSPAGAAEIAAHERLARELS